MRLPGFCIECRRFRYVQVSPSALALAHARGAAVYEGVCHECDNPPNEGSRSAARGPITEVRPAPGGAPLSPSRRPAEAETSEPTQQPPLNPVADKEG